MGRDWWPQRAMPCCGRPQAEVVPLPLQSPAAGEVAAAAGSTEGQPVRELLEQGGVECSNPLLLQPHREQLPAGGGLQGPQPATIQAGAGAQRLECQFDQLLLGVPQLGRPFRQVGHPLAAAGVELLQHGQHLGAYAVPRKGR